MTVITKNKEIIIDRDAITHIFTSTADYNNYKKSLEKNNETTEKGNLIAEWLFNGNADDIPNGAVYLAIGRLMTQKVGDLDIRA